MVNLVMKCKINSLFFLNLSFFLAHCLIKIESYRYILGSIQESRPTCGSFRGSFCGSFCGSFYGSFCEFRGSFCGSLAETSAVHSRKFARNFE